MAALALVFGLVLAGCRPDDPDHSGVNPSGGNSWAKQ
jgi:hypothetical protein